MNCRSFVVVLFVIAGLVPGAQTASASKPTARHATATATILPMASIKSGRATIEDSGIRDPQTLRRPTVKYMNAEGRLVAPNAPNAHPIIILDLP
jgi:hypothetical protein